MKNKIFGKGLAFAIVILFAGMNIITVVESLSIEKHASAGIEKSYMPINARGNILYVGGSGPGNYSSIQDAVNHANDSDTVYVFSGTYNETVTIQKTIDLIGEDKNITIIDGKNIPNRVGVVFLQYGGDSLVTGFTIQHGGDEAGVNIWSNNNVVTGNIIINNNDGIRIYGDYNTISENIVKDNNDYGINLYDSYHNSVINNIFESGDGIYITLNTGDIYETWGTQYMEGNTANGRPIYYYGNKNGIVVPSDASQVILGNCHDCIVQNLSISDIEVGILIGGESGVNHILGNSITNTSRAGIEIEHNGLYNIISENTIAHNNLGIFLVDSCYNNICGNYITNNDGAGILSMLSTYPGCSTPLSENIEYPSNEYNNIYRNTITKNGNGIFMDVACYNNVFENNITNNNYGIQLYASYLCPCSSNNIYQNNITDNEMGIKITEEAFANARYNKIYHNNFIGNTENTYSDGNNIWDNGSAGNYWDDYKGWDILAPYGIGDIPYYIKPHPSVNKDRYPLMKPYPNAYTNQASQIQSIIKQNSQSIHIINKATNGQLHCFYFLLPNTPFQVFRKISQ